VAATMVLRRGVIHTMAQPATARAIALRNGRIVAVGSEATAWAAVGSDVPTVDLGGRVVLPGFTDAHLHWAGFALLRRRLALDPGASLAEALRATRLHAATLPPSAWLVGRGWDQTRWGRWPTATDLDTAVADRPAVLTRKDGHCVWLNSAALAACGITRATPDPPGGEITRLDGAATGVLKENAIELAYGCLPEPAPVERQAAMIEAWRDAWRHGLTGAHDMGFGTAALFRDLATLRDAGDLGLRFVWYLPREALDEAVGLGLRSGLGDAWLRVGGLKLFLDGTLGSQTADLIEPYEGGPGRYGMATLDPGEYVELVERASHAGLATAVHAIGDGAVRTALDGFARVPNGRGGDGRPLRRRIEHCQLVAPSDVRRFDALGVIASVQPIHMVTDMALADQHWGARTAHAYAWRSLLDAGATLAFGSDAPVESLDVFAGIHAAVTRQGPGHLPRDGWHPEQRLSVHEAIHGFTAGPALASGQSDELGTLQAGRRADLIVVDHDPFTVSARDLAALRVQATMIDGIWVWQAQDVDLAGPRHGA
jgi:predicted amidohydrolase YtcJ